MTLSRPSLLLAATLLPLLAGGTASAESPTNGPPAVHFSQAHAETCKITVGDVLPLTSLLDTQGVKRDMSQMLGDRLTVVLFWNDRQAYAWAAYQRFAVSFIQPFADRGVKGIAVDRGDTEEDVKAAAATYGAGIETLLDVEDELWQQIATAKLPRLYLLDRTGKVLWMDIEFSEGTQRDLLQAIQFYLQ